MVSECVSLVVLFTQVSSSQVSFLVLGLREVRQVVIHTDPDDVFPRKTCKTIGEMFTSYLVFTFLALTRKFFHFYICSLYNAAQKKS